MFAWLARLLSGVFSLKVFMGGLFMTVLAVIGYNLIVEVVSETLEFAMLKISGQTVSGVTNPNITGFAGWFIAQIKIPEVFAVITTFVLLKWTLRKIPFLRW
jgi:hypothetical protein